MLKLGALVRFCLLSGAKRTWPSALHMSAFDPKRTYTRRSMSPNPPAATACSDLCHIFPDFTGQEMKTR